ncbi:hypothetical protein BX285_5294 [Streptomyces sp. 1114.5]|nr:hypothetical protein [Streptomyces sp. 1114.5]RKT11346.1 hypothetical protein BX285_5294 [Streptomyces sp. 1114.5]
MSPQPLAEPLPVYLNDHPTGAVSAAVRAHRPGTDRPGAGSGTSR